MEKDNQQVTCCELTWLAAMIDAEGWISMFKQTYGKKFSYWVVVGMSNTDTKLLDKFTSILNKLEIPYHSCNRPDQSINMPVIQLRIGRANSMVKLFDILIPYLICKKDRALLAREWVNEKICEAIAKPVVNGKARKTVRIKKIPNEYDHKIHAVMKALQKPGNLREHTWASAEADKICSELRRKSENWPEMANRLMVASKDKYRKYQKEWMQDYRNKNQVIEATEC